jgi:hypothetical protein
MRATQLVRHGHRRFRCDLFGNIRADVTWVARIREGFA